MVAFSTLTPNNLAGGFLRLGLGAGFEMCPSRALLSTRQGLSDIGSIIRGPCPVFVEKTCKKLGLISL